MLHRKSASMGKEKACHISFRFLPLVLGFVAWSLGAWADAGYSQSKGGLVRIETTVPSTPMTVCADADTFSVRIENSATSMLQDIHIQITLPAGIFYVTGSARGIAADETIDPNRPVFSLSNLSPQAGTTAYFLATAGCEAMIRQGQGQSLQNITRVYYVLSGKNYYDEQTASHPYNCINPSLSIHNRMNGIAPPLTVRVGEMFRHTITVLNGDFGAVHEWELAHEFGADLQVVRIESGPLPNESLPMSGGRLTWHVQSQDMPNGALAQNDSMSITLVTRIIGCDPQLLQTVQTVQWGCRSAPCQTAQSRCGVVLSAGVPYLKVTYERTPDYYTLDGGELTYTYTLANTGDGVAANIEPVWQDFWYAPVLAGTIEVGRQAVSPTRSTIYSRCIAGAPPDRSQYFHGVNLNISQLLLTADPDGAGSGLEDIDGDGNYAELAPGQSFTITFRRRWLMPCDCPAPGTLWAENGKMSISYTNVCNQVVTANQKLFSHSTASFVNISALNTFIPPTDFVQDQVQDIEGRVQFSAGPSLRKICPDAVVKLLFTLPAGLQYVPGSFRTAPGSKTVLPLLYESQNGNLITIGLDGCRDDYKDIALSYLFQVRTVCDQVSSTGQVSLSAIYAIENQTTRFINVACLNSESYVHCSGGACPYPRLLGMQVQRLTRGFKDSNDDHTADDDSPADPLAISHRYGIAGDRFLISCRTLIHTGQAFPSWDHLYLELASSHDSTLLYQSGTWTLVKGNGAANWSGVLAAPETPSSSPGKRWLWCLGAGRANPLPEGVVLEEGDSVFVQLTMKMGTVTQDYPQETLLRSYAFALVEQNRYGCDSWGARLFGLKTGTRVNVNLEKSVSGCRPLLLQGDLQSYYFSYTNPDEFFPNEVRRLFRYDALQFVMPPGMSYIAGSASRFLGGEPTESMTAHGRMLVWPQLNMQELKEIDEYVTGNFEFSLAPDCQDNTMVGPAAVAAPETRVVITQNPDQEPTARLEYALGAYNIQDVQAHLQIQALPQTLYATAATAEWRVQVENRTSVSAPYTWLHILNPSGLLQLQSVKDVASETALPLVHDPDRGGVFVHLGDLAGAQMRALRISVACGNCAQDSLLLSASWSCKGYPSAWNTVACTPVGLPIYLKSVPSAVSLRLDNFNGSIPLCSDETIELSFVNPQASTVYQPKLFFTLPAGMEYIPGSTRLVYPAGSAAVPLSDPVLQSSDGPAVWDLSAIAGLSSLPPSTDKPRNEGRLLFSFTTNCQFISGSVIPYGIDGVSPCGTTIRDYQFSPQVTIQGAEPTVKTSIAVDGAPEFAVCDDPHRFTVLLINDGPIGTQVPFNIQLDLPAGFDYVENSMRTLAAAFKSLEPQVMAGGRTWMWNDILIKGGETVEFSFEIAGVPSSGAADSAGNMIIRTMEIRPVTCIATGAVCLIPVINGQAGRELQKQRSPHAELETSVQTTSTCRHFLLQTEMSLAPDSPDIPAGTTILLQWFHDRDGDGSYSAGDVRLDSTVYQGGLAQGEKITRQRAILLVAAPSFPMHMVTLATLVNGTCSSNIGTVATILPECVQSAASLGDKVWYDLNYNGIQDRAEPGVANVTVYLLSDSLAVVATTQTDEAGEYLFTDVPPDTYYVQVVPPAGMLTTRSKASPDEEADSDVDRENNRTKAIVLLQNMIRRDCDAGLIASAEYQDYGDAPDTYQTLKSSQGAVHDIGDIWLGSLIDGEVDANVIDRDDQSGLSDEDGVLFLGSGPAGGPFKLPYLPNSIGAVQITVSGRITPEHPAYVHAWIDWNGKGTWSDPADHIIAAYRVQAAGVVIVEFPVPGHVEFKDAWARFRVDDQDVQSSSGHALNGEVEDYMLEKWTPVELADFSATAEADGIRLRWSTSSETDNLGFFIYRSEHAETDFAAMNLQIIQALGHSNTLQTYSYLDRTSEPGKNYYYRLHDVSFSGRQTVLATTRVNAASVPTNFSLAPNFPNPFNPGTRIKFSVPQTCMVRLVVSNISGQIIRHLLQEVRTAGDHAVYWDGKDDKGAHVAAGIYLYQMTAGSHTFMGKMTYAK